MQTAAGTVQAHVAERERTGKQTATADRLLRAGEGAYEVTPGDVQRILVAPLDRLFKDGRITAREHDTGDWFRALAYMAAIDPGTMSVDWNQAGGGGASAKVPAVFTSQRIADARIEYRRLEKAIRGVIWIVLRKALIHEHSLAEIGRAVFGHDNDRDARAAGAAGFRMALAALADWRER